VPCLANVNPCSLCNANCCKSYIITATSFDIIRIASRIGKKSEEFATLHQARLLSFDPDTTLDIENDPWTYILGLKSHPCGFLNLKTNSCIIHDCAPLSCRRYPFTLNNKLNARFCPILSQLAFRIKGADITTHQLTRELDQYKKIVKEWNKKPGKKEDCIEFLIKQSKKID
jgi:Fe-S-cluster containining protein